jgi:hypothetical protein
MATSVDLGSVLDRAYEDFAGFSTLRRRRSLVSRNATTRCFPRSSASRPWPNWGATSTSLWPESSSRSPGSFSPVASRYRIQAHPPLDIAYECDP